MTSQLMYWITRCDSIVNAAIIITVISALVFAVFVLLFILTLESNFREDKALNSMARRAIFMVAPVFALSLGTSVFVPTTKEMAAIIVIPKIANSEVIGEISNIGMEMVRFSKDWLMEKMNAK